MNECYKLIINPTKSIVKYKPITSINFFELNELFIILDIIHLIQHDIKILSINDFSLIEFIKYMYYKQKVNLYLSNDNKLDLIDSRVKQIYEPINIIDSKKLVDDKHYDLIYVNLEDDQNKFKISNLFSEFGIDNIIIKIKAKNKDQYTNLIINELNNKKVVLFTPEINPNILFIYITNWKHHHVKHNNIVDLTDNKKGKICKFDDDIKNAINYCKTYDIPYWNTNIRPFQDKFGKLVLEETFGTHQPIIYYFKTPAQLHTAKSITLRLPSGRRLTSKSSSINLLSRSTTKSTQKSIKYSKKFSISAFLKPSTTKLHDISFKSQKSPSSRTKSISYNRLVPLLPELEYFANRINQTGYLIDSRRDFSQTDPTKQNAKWWEINKQFRYYKHKDDQKKMHLDELVRSKLKDNTISQAWLKMYEIITDCNLVPTRQKGVFHSFHIAEAPGTFINALNNYIHTKTAYTGFEWHAQSLHTKGTRIGDQFGLIKRHRERWDWGADETGDITSIRNIKYYKKQVASRPTISLMTSDAGLSMKESGYERVAFASLLAILDILPTGASMVYKILTPIDEPLILNLIYVAYCNFRQLIFYKPVQNNQSREFYIIGKGYLGTQPKILEVFYNELKVYKEGSAQDLFKDRYPEAFVRQFVAISRQLADNYCYTIERNIYYLDNYEHITPEFARMAKDYYDEKNQDWLDKYKPRRIENEVDKL
jgi:hypothetical protein